jgi:endoglucanase
VPLWCSEFGVLRKRAAPGDRAAWLRDVREELEQRGIGWTHWDWKDNFGIVSGGKADPKVVEALGLKPAK